MSAYALFFRDTQAAIKGQNPSASFGEVSKIVASMWDGLDPTQKEVSVCPLPQPIPRARTSWNGDNKATIGIKESNSFVAVSQIENGQIQLRLLTKPHDVKRLLATSSSTTTNYYY